MPGVITSEVEREFFVWVNPDNMLVENNLGLVGSFFGGPMNVGDDRPANLQFISNPSAGSGFVSPFHNGVVAHYRVEYNLESHRYDRFRGYPSRLWALYLLGSRGAAEAYARNQPMHVRGRILKRAVTKGRYAYSVHDSAWIDFLRLGHSVDAETHFRVAEAYWTGDQADRHELISCGKPWKAVTAFEVLFYGSVEFPIRDLSKSD